MVAIERERAEDAGAVEDLLDRAFGPARFAKTCQRLRDGRIPARGLALVARAGERTVGTVRLWPVEIGGRTPALLLGPLAVDAEWRGRGVGARLMRAALSRARALGHGAVLLVGDPGYYARFGFRTGPAAHLALPGPVERARFLALELVGGALAGASGAVAPAAPRAPLSTARRIRARIAA